MIVGEQEQFAIQTYLSRKLQGTTFLKERPRTDGDSFRRHGLPWVTALARVELGAMLAGFTSQPKPFQAVKPTAFDLEEYRELLVDGQRTHFWSLKHDPVIRNYFKYGIPENHIITYGRRASVARHFLQAVRDYYQNELLAIQQNELKAQEVQINRLQLAFLYCLTQKSARSETTSLKEHLSACPPLLEAAERELGVVDRGTIAQDTITSPRLSDLLRKLDPSLIAVPCQ